MVVLFMLKLLQKLSEKAILLGDFECSPKQRASKWLGYSPASQMEISKVEQRLGLTLPNDYKQFLAISNGFPASVSVEPSLLSIQQVGFLTDIDPSLIDTWKKYGPKETGAALERSLIIGGINEEQHFLLLPPTSSGEKWEYWKFASWIPGEEVFQNMEGYFNDVLAFIEDELRTQESK